MSKHRMPDQPTFWDTAEKVIFYALVPLRALTVLGLLAGLITSAVLP